MTRHFRTAALVVAVLLMVATRVAARGKISQVEPTALVAANGHPGGMTGAGQGSDQGEDQGENIDQYSRGRRKIGPTTVLATNSIRSGVADGGAGGNVTATFVNHVITVCGSGVPHTVPLPETVELIAGEGGRGGSSGTGQGSDQGEDQGENIGQHARVGADVSPVSVRASNTNMAGAAVGGAGGSVTILFHTIVTCVAPGTTPQLIQPVSPTVSRDSHGNIRAVYAAATSCNGTPPQHFVMRAGNGGNGGATGRDQGSDQGEDQGENIGKFSTGSVRGGPVRVRARNTLTSADAIGGQGANVTVTFENSIDVTCAAANVTLVTQSPIVAKGGLGGTGGLSGQDQGSDQGEDQGENIGKDAKNNTRVGQVRVTAHNLNVSGAVNGGDGGHVSVTYNDEGTCAAPPTTLPDERVDATGGAGGQGGQSGTGQGSDQGEDQGENIGRYTLGRVYIGNVSVLAWNTNRAGIALGGNGGAIDVGYRAASCSPSTGARSEIVSGTGGVGGHGGASGTEQGADQGEDQGENIGQHANGNVRINRITVHAVNLNSASDADGGRGGEVVLRSGSPACQAPSLSPDSRVRSQAGTGGAGGTSGEGQGSDQGEDQGENIGGRGKKGAGTAKGRTSIQAKNDTHVGNTRAGDPGQVRAFACAATSSVRSLAIARSSSRTTVARSSSRAAFAHGSSNARSEVSCRTKFSGSVYDLIVPPNATCTLTRNARIRHSVEVESDGTLIVNGAFIEQDVSADGAKGILFNGGVVGHDLAVEATKAAKVPGGNRICGVRVGHDLEVADTTKRAGPFTVGGIRGCSGNTIGHNLLVDANAGGAIVARNGAEHSAECEVNRYLRGGENRAGQTNSCPNKRL